MWAEIGTKQESVEIARGQMENYAQDIANRLHLGEKGLDIQEQMHMMQAHERLALQLGKQEERCKELEARIDDLEKETPMNRQVRKWVIGAVTGIATLVGWFVAKAVGLM